MIINVNNAALYVFSTQLIILSGSLIPFISGNQYNKLLLVFLLLLFLFFIRKSVEVSPRLIAVFLIFMSFYTALFFIREDVESIVTYLGYLVRWCIALLFVILFTKDRLISAYTNIMVGYSAVAIIFFIIGFIFPNYIVNLPVAFNDAGTGYRHLIIYFYQGISSWNYRNAGLFWEAGAFQVFLMLALLFESFIINGKRYRRLILISCMLTTLSTLGVAIVLVYLIAFFSKRPRLSHFVLPTICLPLFLFYAPIRDLVLAKFSSGHSSGTERLIGQIADIQIFTEFPLFGVGLDNYSSYFDQVATQLGAYIPTSTNSFLGMLSLNGIIFSSVVFICYTSFFFFLKIRFELKVFIYLFFSLVLCTQGITNQLLFICLVLYGMRDILALLGMKPSRVQFSQGLR